MVTLCYVTHRSHKEKYEKTYNFSKKYMNKS